MDFTQGQVRGMYLSSRMCRGSPAGLMNTRARALEDRQSAHWEVTLYIRARSWGGQDGTSGSGNAQHGVDVDGGE